MLTYSLIVYTIITMGRYFIVSVALTLSVIFQKQVDARSTLRIVNGTDAKKGELTYMVQLYDGWESFICGGAILSSEWILTAGTCVGGEATETIIYGTNQLNNLTRGFPNNSVRVKDWFRHPKFDGPWMGKPLYDVGLLQLRNPLPLGENVQPIKLPEANATIPFHVQGVVSGWGYNETRGKITTNLQKINVQLLTDEECTTKINDYAGPGAFDSTLNLCSDDYWSGPCTGDQGDPFVVNGTQYGILSWGYAPCGIAPNAYSRLTNPEFRNWIKRITNI